MYIKGITVYHGQPRRKKPVMTKERRLKLLEKGAHDARAQLDEDEEQEEEMKREVHKPPWPLRIFSHD